MSIILQELFRSPEFKKAMDDYEAFFDEYVAVMKEPSENPPDLSMQYAKFLSQHTEAITTISL